MNNSGPHVGIIKFNIFVHKILPDGSIDNVVVDCSDLFRDIVMSNKAEISLEGIDRIDCVNKLKEKLEKLKND